MKEVLSSGAEAEMGCTLAKLQERLSTLYGPHQMGHMQDATTITTDYSTDTGISDATVKQRQSKAINMHFYSV
jgi:hypothetical protein